MSDSPLLCLPHMEGHMMYLFQKKNIGKAILSFKMSSLDGNHLCICLISTYQVSQHAQWTLNKIEKTFNGTFAGRKSMHPGFKNILFEGHLAA